MMKYLLFLLLGLFYFPVFTKAQLQGQAKVDSLVKELPGAVEDTTKVKILYKIAWGLRGSDPDKGLLYANQSMQLAKKLDWKPGIATVYNTIGTLYQGKSELDSAVKYITISRQMYEKLGDKKGVAKCLGNVGGAYMLKGDLSTAADLLLRQQKILEEIRVPALLSTCYTNLGGVYVELKNFPQALSYFQMALKQAELAGSKQAVADGLYNIGSFYLRTTDYASALNYLEKATAAYEALGNNQGQAIVALGSAYLGLNKYAEALSAGAKAKEIAAKTGDKSLIADAVFLLGRAYLKIAKDSSGNIPQGINQDKKFNLINAVAELKQATVLAEEADVLAMLAEIYKYLAEAYKLSGNTGAAYDNYLTYIKLRDSLSSNDTRLKIAALETKRESDLKEKQIEINKAQARAKRNEQGLFLAGIVLLLVVVSVVVWSNRKQKRANKRLAEEKEKSDKLAAELEELNTVKDKLFSAISHDLRSPLGRITNMLYMMQRGNMTEEKLKERTTEFLGAMQQTMQMLDNLLYWATSQMKGLTLSKTNIRINELVEENLELMQAEATVKKIELIDKIGETANAMADANMTRLVLRNLISNAIKFTPENGSITITAEALADKVRVQVKDTGIGMSPETIKALMANKQVESRSGTQKEKGFGIGLQLCKDFIEQNGGKLEITSEPGSGSTFSFTLPAS